MTPPPAGDNVAARFAPSRAPPRTTFDDLAPSHEKAPPLRPVIPSPLERTGKIFEILVQVAKTLIVKTAEGYLRAVVPASRRLDERKVRDVAGGSKKDVHLATEDDLRRDYPDFELGAVPPVGGTRHDEVIVDSRVVARETVVLEAGSHEQSVQLTAADLVRAADAKVADICKEDD